MRSTSDARSGFPRGPSPHCSRPTSSSSSVAASRLVPGRAGGFDAGQDLVPVEDAVPVSTPSVRHYAAPGSWPPPLRPCTELRCHPLHRIQHEIFPPVKLWFMVEADRFIKDWTIITEYVSDVDYLRSRELDDDDNMMALLSASPPSKSLVVYPDKRSNIARYIRGGKTAACWRRGSFTFVQDQETEGAAGKEI